MNIQSVLDPAFALYGKVLDGYELAPLLKMLVSTTDQPVDGTIYIPSDAALESLPIFGELRDRFYGGMPIQFGYCNGSNVKLNALEYHRDSEVNVAADDIVLLVASLQKLRDGILDTKEVEAFCVPAGTAIQLYETTLHYAPCNAPGGEGFRVAVVLPRGTNTGKPDCLPASREDRLLWARNKWLAAHPDSDEAKQGAFVGLVGENITLG